MTTRVFVLALSLAAPVAAPVLAQKPTPQPPAPTRMAVPPPTAAPQTTTPPAPPTPRPKGQAVNVKIEFTLTDQHAGSAPSKRTVTLVVADLMGGSIRSQSDVAAVANAVPLNIDATPELLPDGKLRLGFTVQYDWTAPVEQADNRPPARGTVFKTALRESASLILESGKPMVAAQSADPVGDRQVTVEVKATVLR